MHSWRITKYNPQFRNERGAYLKDDWTSISDIGRKYDGIPFVIKSYQGIEDMYVKAILTIVEYLKVPHLQVNSLWKQDNVDFQRNSTNKFRSIYSKDLVDAFSIIKEGELLHSDSIAHISRLILRENLWCRFQYESSMFVHFGYDYYMYIGSSQDCESVISKIVASGLFVESFESPYHEDDNEI